MSPLTDLIDQLGGWPVLETEGSPWNELQFQWDETVFKLRDNGKLTLVFQLQDTVRLFGTRLVFDPIHLPKSETGCLIGSDQNAKEPFLLIGSCCFEVYHFHSFKILTRIDWGLDCFYQLRSGMSGDGLCC